MGGRDIRAVAVIGDGPAGTTLAAHLARGGLRVALFARGRPALVVGESLVPAVVPYLRELGIEEEVRAYAVHKPGATFAVREGDALAIRFADACTRVPGYAYNVPRDRFDATLLGACERAGARVIRMSADIARGADPDREVRLAGPARDAAASALGAQPDLVVDATGRARLLARRLGLPCDGGARHDAALFAHLEGVPIEHPGHVHTDRLERGWCWRIPLPGRVSLGVVVDPAVPGRFGTELAAQYEGILRAEPYLERLTRSARRVSPVVRYGNYQRVSRRGAGPGWALVGDSFGFIDPVFSSGLYLAMSGARSLARAIRRGTPAAFRRYERAHLRHLRAWQRAAGYFYDGRFFALLRLRDAGPPRGAARALHAHVARHLPRVFTGEGSDHRYDGWLLDLVAERALRAPERREPGIA